MTERLPRMTCQKHLALILVLGAAVPADAQNGELLYDPAYVHEIHLDAPFPALYDTLWAHYEFNTDTPGDGAYTQCTITIDGTFIDSIGFRMKGFTSNLNEPGKKKPFKVDLEEFASARKYNGVKKMNLANGNQDPGMMMDVLGYKLCRDAGLPGSRTAYAKLYLNDVYWGLYIMVEEVDKNFLEMNFPDKNGNLYASDALGDMVWEGANKSDYTDNYEQLAKQTGDTSWADLINVLNTINFGTAIDLDTLYDLDQASTLAALQHLIGNADAPFFFGRNYIVYHSTTDDRFHEIPWDFNFSFGIPSGGVMYELTLNMFWQKIKNDPARRSYYLDRVCVLLQTVWQPTVLDAYIDQVHALIRPAVELDTNMSFTLAEFDQIVNADVDLYQGMKPFIDGRAAQIIAELQAEGFACSASGTTERTSAVPLPILFPNPVTGTRVSVRWPFPEDPVIAQLMDARGSVLHCTARKVDEQRWSIELHGAAAGYFMLLMRSDEHRVALPFSVER
jgi:CotH kinase protein